jgi:tetratricopeptide (TPR) repeat protein
LRSVIEWCVESDQAEGALRLIKALLWIWWFNHSINEGLAFALKSLALPSAAQFKEARAGALTTAGFFFCLQGNTASARQSLEEAILILRATGDEASLAWSLQFLGLALAYDKEYDQADAAMNEGLALIRKLKDISPNSLLFFLGDIDLLKGDRSRAKRVYEESVQILRSIGSKSFLAYPLRRLGYLALEQNDVVIANKFFQESLALNYEMGDNPGFTASLVSMAALALRLEQPVVTATLYGAVKNRLETLSINLLFTDQAELDRILNETPSYLDGPVFSNAFTEGLEMSEAQALELATRVFEGKDE